MPEQKFKLYTRAIILSNDKKCVLLIKKRANQKIAPGQLLFPGGTVEFGEEIETTLERELKEETGLHLNTKRFLSNKKRIIGDIHWLGAYYIVQVTTETTPKNMEPEKHETVAFVSIAEALSSPHFDDQELLKEAVRLG